MADGGGSAQVGLAALRFGHQETPEAEGESGRHHPEEGIGPAEHAAEDVAERAADRDGNVEPRQHLAAFLDGVEVCDDRWGDGTVRRFAHANGAARQQQDRKTTCQPRSSAGQGPQKDADPDQVPSIHPVGKPAEHGSEDHVGNHERSRQQAELGLADHLTAVSKVLLDVFKIRREDLPIDVVEQVNAEEQAERQRRPFHGRRLADLRRAGKRIDAVIRGQWFGRERAVCGHRRVLP